jgi:uncharacterized protein (TIGR02757 family)
MRAQTPTLAPTSRLAALRPGLLQFANEYSSAPRLQYDPVELVRRFTEPDDIEVAGLIAAAFAYGRADVFKPRAQSLLNLMGPHPAAFARDYALNPDPQLFADMRYRFNEPEDFAALVASMGSVSKQHGSLGARFGSLLKNGDLRSALATFADELRTAPQVTAILGRRGPRGLRYLLPDARLAGACKRWHLYLRWMVRGPDAVDLGVWSHFVPKSRLVIPLDTHIARVAHYVGLTERTDLSWRTAEEITAGLRAIDPTDPVRFDFALCHHGMSGACPPVRDPLKCRRCSLNTVCRARVLERALPRPGGKRPD